MLCIVVAGGSSTRMVEDKLGIRVGGEPLVCRVVEALRMSTCSEVLVVGHRPPCPVDYLPDDEGLPCGGPARGLATVAGVVESWEEVFIAPGDAGLLQSIVVERLAGLAAALGVDAATPVWGEGFLDSLITYTRGSTLACLREACLVKEEWGCRARVTDLQRCADRLLLVGAGLLADNPSCLAHMNTPWELAYPGPPGTPVQCLQLVEGVGVLHYLALRLLGDGLAAEASRLFLAEANAYRSTRQPLLELHSLIDAERLGARGLSARIAGLSVVLGRTRRRRLRGGGQRGVPC